MKTIVTGRKALYTGLAVLATGLGIFLVSRSWSSGTKALPLLATSQKVGFLPGEFQVSQNGSSVYSVSIEVPPGTNGVQPEIKLVYSSSGSNGIVGQGWQIEGLSSVTRIGRNIPQDSIKGGVTFSPDDRFALNGQRLIAYKDASGTILRSAAAQNAAYGKDGTEYRTEVESGTRVVSQGTCGNGPCSFTAYLRDGSVMYFAQSDDSRIQPNGCPAVSSWAVNKVADHNGNFITVQYSQDKANGSYVPESVAYTGNDNESQSPQRLLQFNYEERKDSLVNFIAGIKFSCAKRLSGIQTFVDLDGNGSDVSATANLVRSYKISYKYSSSTQRSIVQKMEVCDAKGNCLPATTFDWTVNDTTSFFSDSLMTLPTGFSNVLAEDVAKVRGDFDGNGRMDIALLKRNALKMPILYCNENGEFNYTEIAVPAGYSDNFNNPSVETITADYNADGLTDLFFFSNGASTVPILMPGLNHVWQGQKVILPSGFNQTFNISGVTKISGDVDGDGRADFMGFKQGYKSVPVLLSTQSGFSGTVSALPSQVSSVFNMAGVLEYQGGDFNGDGLTDVCVFIAKTASLPVIYSNGRSGFTSSLQKFPSQVSAYATLQTTRRILGDFNGDGLVDLSLFAAGTASVPVMYSNGTGSFEFHSITGANITYFNESTTEKITGDINGDNITDIVGFSAGLKSAPALVSGYNGRFSYHVIPLEDEVAKSMNDLGAERMIGDFNGDGLLDISAIKKGFTTLPVLFANRFNPMNNGPDLLSMVTNGIGNVIQANYLPITDPSIYAAGSVPSVYPLISTQFANFVVLDYQSASAKSDPSTTLKYSMKYEGVTTDLYRGFMGFTKVRTTDYQRNALVEDQYAVDFPYNGMRSAKVIRDLESNALLSQELYTFGSERLNNSKVYSVWNSAYKMRHYTNGHYNYTLSKTFSYDSEHENLLKINDYGDSAVTDDDLFTNFHYVTDNQDWWKNNYPLAEKACKTPVDADWNSWTANDYYWKKFTYDSRMNTVSNSSFVNNNGEGGSMWSGQSIRYDAFGNPTEKRYPPNLSADSVRYLTDYDDVYHTFPVKQTTAVPRPDLQQSAALVTRLQFDPRFDVKILEIDPNNHTVFSVPDYGIDGFGRVLKTQSVRPDNDELATVMTTDYVQSENGFDVVNRTPRDWANALNPDSSWLFTREHYDGFERNTQIRKNGTNAAHEWYQALQFDNAGNLSQRYMPQFLESDTINDSVNGFYLQQYYPHGNLRSVSVTMTGASAGTILMEENLYDPVDDRIVYVKSPSPAANGSYVYNRKQFDAHGRMIESSGPYTAPDSTAKGENFGKVTYYYDPMDRMYKVVDPVGESNVFTHNSVNEIIVESAPETGTTSYVFNANLLKTKRIGEEGKLIWKYDDLGRPIHKSAVSTAGQPKTIASYIYDSDSLTTNGKGNLSWVITPEVTYGYSYDNLGNNSVKTVKMTELPQTFVQTYTYDPAGNIASSLLPDSSLVDNKYDYAGNLSRIRMNGSEVSSYADYDPQGNFRRMNFQNGVSSTYSYNSVGNLTSSKTEKGAYVHQDLTYTWNNAGKLMAVVDNQTQNETDENAAYDYFQSGRLQNAASVTGTENYGYDAAGNRLFINDLTYTYDQQKKHQLKQISLQNVVLNNFSYNTAGYETGKTVGLDSSAQAAAQLNFNYRYDVQGNMTGVYELGDSNDTIVVNEMTYDDDQQRIIKRDKNGVVTYYISDNYEVTRLSTGKKLYTKYILDAGGVVYAQTSNEKSVVLLKETDAKKLVAHTTAFGKYLKNSDWPGAGTGFLLISVIAIALWVLVGAVPKKRWKRLPGISISARIKVAVFLLACCGQLSQYALAEELTPAVINPGANGPGVPVAGETRYFHHNQIGSNVMLTDQTGGLTNTIAYKPFGTLDLNHSTGEDNFRYKFTGKELDYYSGLQYFGSRYYDSQSSRFTAPDPAQQYFSPYIYGNDDPLQGIDPDGELFFEIALVIGAIVFAYAGASLANQTLDPTQWKWDSAETWVGLIAGAVAGVAVVASGGAALAAFGLVAAESVTVAGISASTLAFTAMDVSFLIVDTYTFADDPSVANGIFLGLDLIPFAGALLGRASKGARLAGGAERVAASESKVGNEARRLNSIVESCPLSFLEGTAVDQPEGPSAIEDLQVGDLVMGYDEETGQEGAFAVSKLHRRIALGYLLLVIGGSDTLAVTPEHPFYKEHAGWTSADKLHIGDRIVSESDASFVASTGKGAIDHVGVVTGIKEVPGDEVVVYNLEVERSHNYYVGKSKVLVHNGCKVKSKRLRALGRTPGKNTATGRKVFERMKGDGFAKLSGGKKYVKVAVVRGGPRVWRVLDRTIHMGHIEDAVTVWNKGSKNYFGGKALRTFGAKSKQAREFMLDAKNYEFEFGPLNSSNGAMLGQTYLPPQGHTGSW